MPVELCTDIDKQLDTLADRLADEFGDRVPRRQVRRTVNEVRDEFGAPPVRDFLPILVERGVRAALKQ